MLLPFEEGKLVFVDEDVGPGNGNALRLFLKPKDRLAEMTRVIRNLARVCYETRHEVMKHCAMMPVLGDGRVPFRPREVTICIYTRPSRNLFPVYTTRQVAGIGGPGVYRPTHLGSLSGLHPLPRSVRHLALRCLPIRDEHYHNRDWLVVIFFLLASEVNRLRLFNVREHCSPFINDLRALGGIATDDISNVKVIDRLSLSNGFLEQRWHRVRGTTIVFEERLT